MAIPQYTTPTVSLVFDDDSIDLTAARNVYVTFKYGSQTLTKTGSDLTLTANQIDVYLSQSETGKFGKYFVELQANWTDAFGNRVASNIAKIDISDQLLKEVIE